MWLKYWIIIDEKELSVIESFLYEIAKNKEEIVITLVTEEIFLWNLCCDGMCFNMIFSGMICENDFFMISW